jgi:NADH dehydrogenase FAD-containing subunit
MPGKTVTLISEGQSLFPEYTPGFGRRLEKDLDALGVRLIKGKRVGDLKSTDRPVEGPLSLSDGKSIDPDLVIPATGSRFDNTLLRTVPQATFDNVGRAVVDSWLRLPGFANIFVLGDAAANGDKATIVAVMRQCDWLAKHLLARAGSAKSEKLAAYRPYKVQPILVPVGPLRGASVLPFGAKGLTVGARFTSAIKGKDLFVSRYRGDFGSG